MNKKEKIIEVAKDIFAQNGYHGTSMDEIAAKAGVAKGTIYNYFPNKEELFVDVILELLSIVDEWLEKAKKSDKGFWQKIEYLSGKVLRFFTENKQIFTILRRETPVNTAMSERGEKEIMKMMKSRVNKMAEIFKKHRPDGVISGDYTDQEGAFLCLVVVESMVRRTLEGWEKDPEKNTELVMRFLKNGLAKN